MPLAPDAEAGGRSATRWCLVCFIALCGATLSSAAVEAQQIAEVGPGEVVRLVVPVPSNGIQPIALHIEPAHGVTVHASEAHFDDSGEIALILTVPSTTGPGWFSAVTLILEYPQGDPFAMPGYVWVLTADAAAALDEEAAPPGEAPREVLPTREVVRAVITPQPAGKPEASPPPSNTLGGVVYIGATELDTAGRAETDFGMGIDLRGRIKGSTQVDALYIRGWNPGVSPVFRYGNHQSRGHFRVRAPGFTFEAGELRPETPLAGVKAPVDGASFQKTRGQIIGSLAAGVPKYFAGGWGGHLVQGEIRFAFRHGDVGLFASQLARPVLASTIVANPLPPEEDSELVVEDLERVGALLSRENRARAGGIETRLRFRGHHIVARGGWLELVNPSNDRLSGAAATGSYSFATKRASFSSQFRRLPGSLTGVSLSGDLVTAAGKVKVIPSLAIIARSYWTASALAGRSSLTRGKGGALGLEYSRHLTRLYVEGNYRESHFVSTAITRNITAGVRMPLWAAAGVEGAIEIGEVNDGRRRRRIAGYRAAAYLEGERASLMVSGRYRDYAVSSPRLSLDVSGSLSWRGATIEGGSGISRAGIFGDVTNAWTTLEFPVPGDLTILIGADYDRWSFDDSPYFFFTGDDELAGPWRFTFNVRRKLSVPLPFLK